MIFPLVTAAVIAVLYIVIGLYQSVALQTSVHMALRRESGESSETVYRAESGREYDSEKDRIGLRSVIRMQEDREYKLNKPFQYEVRKQETGRSYIIDEAELIRIISFEEEESN